MAFSEDVVSRLLVKIEAVGVERLGAIGGEIKALDTETQALNKSTAAAGAESEAAGARIGKMGSYASLAAVGLAAAGVATVAWAVNAQQAFQDAMSQVEAFTGASKAQMAQYEKGVLDMSATFGVAATDEAQGLYYVASAGFHGAQAMEVLRASTMASAAAHVPMKTVADAVTTSLNAYGLSGAHAMQVTDTLTATVTRGKTTWDLLAGSLARPLSIAPALGVSLAEVGGALATLTNHGFTARQGAMALTTAFRSMLAPTGEMQKAATDLGYSWQDLYNVHAHHLIPTLKTIDELAHKNATSTADYHQNLKNLLGTGAALSAFLTLAGNGFKTASANIDAAAHAAGTTRTAWDITAQDLATQGHIIGTKITDIAIVLGQQFAPKVTAAAKGFSEFLDGALKEIKKRGPEISTSFDSMGSHIDSLGTHLRTLGQDFGLMGASAGKAQKPSEQLGHFMGGLFVNLLLQPIHVLDMLAQAIDVVAQASDWTVTSVKRNWSELTNYIHQSVTTISNMLGVMNRDAWGHLQDFGTMMLNGGKAAEQGFVNAFHAIIGAAADVMGAAVNAVEGAVTGLASALASAGANAGHAFVGALRDALAGAGGLISNALNIGPGLSLIGQSPPPHSPWFDLEKAGRVHGDSFIRGLTTGLRNTAAVSGALAGLYLTMGAAHAQPATMAAQGAMFRSNVPAATGAGKDYAALVTAASQLPAQFQHVMQPIVNQFHTQLVAENRHHEQAITQEDTRYHQKLTGENAGYLAKIDRIHQQHAEAVGKWLSEHPKATKAELDAYLAKSRREEQRALADAAKEHKQHIGDLNQSHSKHVSDLNSAFKQHVGAIDKAMKAVSSPAGLWSKLEERVNTLADNSLKALSLAILNGAGNVDQLGQRAADAATKQKQMGDAAQQAADQVARLTNNFEGLSSAAQRTANQAMNDLAMKIYDMEHGISDTLPPLDVLQQRANAAAAGANDYARAVDEATQMVKANTAATTEQRGAIMDAYTAQVQQTQASYDAAVKAYEIAVLSGDSGPHLEALKQAAIDAGRELQRLKNIPGEIENAITGALQFAPLVSGGGAGAGGSSTSGMIMPVPPAGFDMAQYTAAHPYGSTMASATSIGAGWFYMGQGRNGMAEFMYGPTQQFYEAATAGFYNLGTDLSTLGLHEVDPTAGLNQASGAAGGGDTGGAAYGLDSSGLPSKTLALNDLSILAAAGTSNDPIVVSLAPDDKNDLLNALQKQVDQQSKTIDILKDQLEEARRQFAIGMQEGLQGTAGHDLDYALQSLQSR